jgi:bifunctional UDP-N-acetylglucosamine pyrophosphorylase/glucosamine-1-phosphate N-acetyltransferase
MSSSPAFPLNVIILAAGKGKRMHSDIPKVLHKVGGRSLLAHVVDTALSLDAAAVHVVVGHEAEQIRTAFESAPLSWALQADQLGTGHAVAQAMPNVSDDALMLVLYGDVPLIQADTLRQLLAQAGAGALAVLTLNSTDPHGLGRILRDAEGRAIAIVEEKDATAEQKAIKETNSGIMAVRSAALRQWLGRLKNDNAQCEYYLTDIVGLAVADGIAVETLRINDELEVLGVNNKVQLAQLERHYQRLMAERLLEAGVTLADPGRFDVRGELTCGRDVEIDINCIFEGKVVLGNRVRIGPNVCIKNAVIGDYTVIHANSHIDGAQVAAQCAVGPFARLRPGTVLNIGSKIGNFVETKKATLGAGSKVNHLSYVGDATLGRDVNIGAGTITCNYDGVNKFETRIEDNVFVGSNTALVAPVKIGENATIGAGSTITGDVPCEHLAIARGRQRNIEGWKKPSKK